MKLHIQRYLTQISDELERVEKLEEAITKHDASLSALESELRQRNEHIEILVKDIKNSNVYKALEAERDDLRNELTNLKAEVSKRPIHYWEVTVKLRDGRLGTYAILDWPRNIKADEVFRDNVTLSLHRVVS